MKAFKITSSSGLYEQEYNTLPIAEMALAHKAQQLKSFFSNREVVYEYFPDGHQFCGHIKKVSLISNQHGSSWLELTINENGKKDNK